MFLVNVNTLTFKRSPTYVIHTEAEYTLLVKIRTRPLNLTSVKRGSIKSRQQATFNSGSVFINQPTRRFIITRILALHGNL